MVVRLCHVHPACNCMCCMRREFLGKLCSIVGSNMAELGSQRAAAATEAAGKAAVYKLEKDLSQVESSVVLEPYTGEDLKEILKAAEVLHAPLPCCIGSDLCCANLSCAVLCCAVL